MTLVALQDVLESLESGARPTGGATADSGEIPSLGGEHLNAEGGFDFTSVKRIPRTFFENIRGGRIALRDILVVKDGATTGKTSFVGEDFPFSEAAVNEHVFCVRVDKSRAFPEYVFHFLKSPLGQKAIALDFRGATVGGISRGFAKKIQLPLPPLSQQRRIAEILDKADALRAKRRAALAQLDTLTQCIFLDMFGDPATNPKRWPTRQLGDCAIKFSDGPFGSNLKSSHYTETGIRVVRLQNIGVGRFLAADAAFISEQHFAKLKKHECLPGDVLVGTLGDPNLRACIQPQWLPVALNKADCVQIRANAQKATAEFLCTLLNQSSTERMAQDLMHGQTRVRISMGRLRKLSVPVPPVGLQRAFGERVASVEGLKTDEQSSVAELDTLFASLQHAAFVGKLAPATDRASVAR